MKEYRSARVAVLGAAGFVGRCVARALTEKGAELFLLGRNKNEAEKIYERYKIHGTSVEMDFRQPENLLKWFGEIRPAITFNLAGYGVDPFEREDSGFFEINSELVKYLCYAIELISNPDWNGLDLVHAGSALEYGNAGGELIEDTKIKPGTLYGKSKLMGTLYLSEQCRTNRLKGVTARLFNVYGPGEHKGSLLPSLLDAAYTGMPLPLTEGTQMRDFTYVQDVAEGLLRLGLAKPQEPIVNLATGRLSTVKSFAQTCAQILRIPSENLLFGALPAQPEEMKHTSVSIEKLRNTIGWTPPTTITDGIRETVEWESERMKDDS